MNFIRSAVVLSIVASLGLVAGCAAPVESGNESEVGTTEDAIKSEKALKAAISRTIEGVFTFSESDDDFQYIEAPLADGERISERVVRAKFKSVIEESGIMDFDGVENIDQLGVEIIDFDKWFGDPKEDAKLTDPDEIVMQKKLRTLQRLMKENLTQLKVYEYGLDTSCADCPGDRGRATKLIVGKSKLSNKIVGVRTFATET
jgi:hypothetical protein